MFSMLLKLSPWASPPVPVPVVRLTVMPAAEVEIDRVVDAIAALQRVGAGAALEHVVAVAAVEGVGPGVAGQRVDEGRADDVLDAEGVALGVDRPKPVPVSRLTDTAVEVE